MPLSDEMTFLRRRADQSRIRARDARCIEARDAHLELERHYVARLAEVSRPDSGSA